MNATFTIGRTPKKASPRVYFGELRPVGTVVHTTSIVCPRALAQPATASRSQMLTVRSRRSRSGRGVAGSNPATLANVFKGLWTFGISQNVSATGEPPDKRTAASTQPNTIFSVLIDGRRRLRSASCGGPNQRIAGSVIRREPYSSSATIESLRPKWRA